MRILVKTAGMGREEWLRWRTKGIGGSDVSVIAGVNPFRSIFQLWLEKTGQVEPEETENDNTHFGNVLEPVVKREFSKRTGLKVRAKRALLQSEEYMAVTGAEKTYLAALVGGNRFYWKVVRRDEQKIAEIIALEKAFWEENVLAGREPVPDGSGATTDFLNEKYASSNGNTILLPEEALGLCRRYEELSGQLNELQDKKDAVSNQLKNFLKNNESGVIGEYRVTWKQVTSTTFDKKRLEKENRALYEEYLTKRQYRRLTVA